jgi:HAD superfamily hydrolase (TIGR01509 family)
MKTILVDAVNGLILKGEGVFVEMYEMLEGFPNRKIVTTNADEEKREQYGVDSLPYEVFSLDNSPGKSDPEYYKTLLLRYNLKPDDVMCFEHNEDSVKSAQSVGINTYHYDAEKKDLDALRDFLTKNT